MKKAEKNKELLKQRATSATPGKFPRFKILALGAFVSIITFMVYFPALQNSFVTWDDHVYVYENKTIQSISIALVNWIPEVTIWHPVTMISLALDYAIWELNPFGYHLTNNLIHAFNAGLVFILVVQLMESTGSYAGRIKMVLIASGITSILFGIHPQHVESVVWVSERKDVLSAFFFLLSLLLYLKYTSSSDSKRPIFYGVCLISFVLALLSKPTAVTLPVVLLIIDFYPLKRLAVSNAKWLFIEKLPFFLFSLMLSLITIWTSYKAGGIRSLEMIPLASRIFVGLREYIFYLVKMVFPLNLSPLYPHPGRIDPFNVEYLGPFILFLAISSLSILYIKKEQMFSAIWLYYVITLFPSIAIIQVAGHAAADRNTYLPSLGPFLLVGLGVGIIFDRYKKQILIVITSILIIISGILVDMTVKQIAIWKDSITLWSYVIKQFPDTAFVAYDGRGNTYAKLGNNREAINDFDMAIKINPRYSTPYYNRGVVFANLGEYRRAIADYSKAIELYPQNAEAYNNRCAAYITHLGDYQLAIADCSKAIELNPQYSEAYNNRGAAYFHLGEYKRAITDYSKSIEVDPLSASSHFNRGTAYINSNNFQGAIQDFTKVIEMNPRDLDSYNYRGKAYASLGNYRDAIKDFGRVVELNPQYAEGYYNLGTAYTRLGDRVQADIYYQKAASLGFRQTQD